MKGAYIMENFPHIVISGSPYERGVSYGKQAADLINNALKNYEHLFDLSKEKVSWKDALALVPNWIPAIKKLGAELLEEIRGIADGSQQPFEKILLLNCRSEVFAITPVSKNPEAGEECTTITVLPERTTDGHLIVAQNWDMLHWAGDHALVLEVLRDDGPDMLCICEAGMLARYGLNSSGLALTLSSIPIPGLTKPAGTPSIAIRRKFLSETHFADAYSHIMEEAHMSGMHYAAGSGELGFAMSIEAYPGGKYVLYPQNGLLAHANNPRYQGYKFPDRAIGSTLYRDELIKQMLNLHEKISVQDVKKALISKRGAPFSVCAERVQGRKPDFEQGCTLAGIVMDATARRLWVRRGNNPETPYVEYHWTRPQKAAADSL